MVVTTTMRMMMMMATEGFVISSHLILLLSFLLLLIISAKRGCLFLFPFWVRACFFGPSNIYPSISWICGFSGFSSGCR